MKIKKKVIILNISIITSSLSFLWIPTSLLNFVVLYVPNEALLSVLPSHSKFLLEVLYYLHNIWVMYITRYHILVVSPPPFEHKIYRAVHAIANSSPPPFLALQHN